MQVLTRAREVSHDPQVRIVEARGGSPVTTPAMWHYTCLDHGNPGILLDRRVEPCGPTGLAWFTDLDVLERGALGLTSVFASCDRTAARWRVINADLHLVHRWVTVRRNYPHLQPLEEAVGVMPMHWWVADCPVRVETA